MNQLPTKGKKFKVTLWIIFGIILIPGGIAWTSAAISAWAANIIATESFAQTYQVTDITVRSGPVWSRLYDLDLVNITKQEKKVILRLGRSQWEHHEWKSGDRICVQGRTSLFGTIVDITSPCGKKN